MARYGQPNFSFLISTVSTTAAYQDLSDHVLEFSGLDIEALLQQSDGFGDSWREQLYTGMRQVADLTINCFYEDTAATGPHAVFGGLTALGAERQVKLKFGTTNEYPKFKVVIKNYARLPKRGELTGSQLVLAVTGAVTNGTT